MLQRIQTIYLILAMATLMMPFLGDIFTLEFSGRALYGVGVVSGSDLIKQTVLAGLEGFHLVSIIGLFLNIFLIVFVIFQFKKRPLQLKLIRVAHLLTLAVLVYWFIKAGEISEQFSGVETLNVAYGMLFYGPVGAVAFLILAQKAVKKDEDLVKSLDRLR
ncbi:MAG: hypothetical protein ACI9YL_001619 [Luteibaculaceae bacterium]|jgi:hypothetical protein